MPLAENFIGIDGCRNGWIIAVYSSEDQKIFLRYAETLTTETERLRTACSIWIDMPVGLSGNGVERTLDHQLRQYLKWRKASVFIPPSYEALAQPTYEEANRIQRKFYDKGLSRQAWNLRNKIQELHGLLMAHPELVNRVYESHPEVVFQSLWRRKIPMAPKSIHLGFLQRLEIIRDLNPHASRTVTSFLQQRAAKLFKKDDVLDALVLALKAASGQYNIITQHPDGDSMGFPLRVVF